MMLLDDFNFFKSAIYIKNILNYWFESIAILWVNHI